MCSNGHVQHKAHKHFYFTPSVHLLSLRLIFEFHLARPFPTISHAENINSVLLSTAQVLLDLKRRRKSPQTFFHPGHNLFCLLHSGRYGMSKVSDTHYQLATNNCYIAAVHIGHTVLMLKRCMLSKKELYQTIQCILGHSYIVSIFLTIEDVLFYPQELSTTYCAVWHLFSINKAR